MGWGWVVVPGAISKLKFLHCVVFQIHPKGDMDTLPDLQIKEGTEDNSWIIFLISQ